MHPSHIQWNKSFWELGCQNWFNKCCVILGLRKEKSWAKKRKSYLCVMSRIQRGITDSKSLTQRGTLRGVFISAKRWGNYQISWFYRWKKNSYRGGQHARVRVRAVLQRYCRRGQVGSKTIKLTFSIRDYLLSFSVRHFPNKRSRGFAVFFEK